MAQTVTRPNALTGAPVSTMAEPQPLPRWTPGDVLDTRGLLCPQPIIDLARAITRLTAGDTLILLSNDIGILEDLPAWCGSTRNRMVSLEREERWWRGVVEKRG